MIKSLSKQERLKLNLFQAIQEYVSGKHFSGQTKASIAKKLSIPPQHFPLLDAIFSQLVAQKILIKEADWYLPAPSQHINTPSHTHQGKIAILPRGFGFVTAPGQDIFIPKNKIANAIDGDLVEVAIELAQSEKGPEGRVVRVVERSCKRIVGTVTAYTDKKVMVFSLVLNDSIPCHIEETSPTIGDRVIAKVLSWDPSAPPVCVIESIIGPVSDPSTDVAFAIAENTILTDFPQTAIEQAQSFGTEVPKEAFKDRVDLRNTVCFTIDPDTAKDFDDAVSLERIGTKYRLGVHIADVSYYVTPGSPIDIQAALRCNSTYFPNICIPMIPHELSDHLCSLCPNVPRLTVSIFIDIDQDGTTIGWEIVRSVIESQARFTYKNVMAILDGKETSPFEPTLQTMAHLCHLLQEQRSMRGSVQLHLAESIIRVAPNGEPTGTELIEYDISHQMVEEFMIKANEIVATELSRRGFSVPYRIHDEPAKENLQSFASLAAAFGCTMAEHPSPQEIQKLFAESAQASYGPYLASSYIRSMRLACYSPENIGHYGLSLEFYSHFTSPIRRYIDIIIHRLLLGPPMEHEALLEVCSRASQQERCSARAENSCMTMKKLRYISLLQRTDKHFPFKAIITKVKPFGITFDIIDVMMDGFLHVSELDNDYFLFEDNKLVGSHNRYVYQCGTQISVRCVEVDLVTQTALWELLSDQ